MAAYLAASDISAIDVPTETLAEAVRGAVKAGEAEVGGAEVHEKAESCYFFIGRRANPPDGGSTPLGELRLRLAEELRARGKLTRFLPFCCLLLTLRFDRPPRNAHRARSNMDHRVSPLYTCRR